MKDNISVQQILNRFPVLKYRNISSFPSDNVPDLPNETFTIINTQPSNLHSDHWILIVNIVENCILQISLDEKSRVLSKSTTSSDARTTTVSTQLSKFLHDKGQIWSLQVPTRIKKWSSR